MPVRAGFIVFKSATTPGSAIPFGIPPGMGYLITAGTGIKLETVDLDLGLAYEILAGKTVSAAENPGGPGEYSGRAFVGTVSANFRP